MTILFMVRQCEGDILDTGKHKGVYSDIEDALVWCVAVAKANPFDAVIVERIMVDDPTGEQEPVFTCGPIGRKTVNQLERDNRIEASGLHLRKELTKNMCSCCGTTNGHLSFKQLPNGNTCQSCVDLLIEAACRAYVEEDNLRKRRSA